MPTNKLWLEHTEKAAWDTVQALREKIANAERRMERLIPSVGAWQPLLDQLDRARAEIGLNDESYSEVLRLLLERAARQSERVLELERERAKRVEQGEPRFDVVTLTSRPIPELFDDDDDSEPRTRRAAQLERAFQRRKRELLAEHVLPDDVDELLHSIDTKVADLAEIEGKALSDAALDLAVLALALAGLSEHDEE